MHRLLTSRSALVPLRHLSSATPAPSPPSKPPSDTPPTSQPPPPKPPRSLFRRTLPVALIGATSYLAYRLSTDHQFRTQFEQVLPSLSPLVSNLPEPPLPAHPTNTDDEPSAVSAHSADPSVSTPKPSNLPPGYDSLPHLLQKIDESNAALSASNTPRSQPPESTTALTETQPANDAPVEQLTPSERAKAKMAQMKDEASSSTAGGVMGDRSSGAPAVGGESEPAGNTVEEPTTAVGTSGKDMGSEPSKTAGEGGAASPGSVGNVTEVPAVRGTSGKDKLQRLLGKGGFDTDKVEGPDVVDDSVYRKPESWKRGAAPEKSTGRKVESGRRLGGGGAMRGWGWGRGGGDGEVEKLKKELESLTKWEAVRLQEAVRAQLVEDKKEAAKAAALMAKGHAEEMEKIKLEARREMERVLGERTVEIQKRANRERDEDVRRLLKVKEVELRERMVVEYAEKERADAVERKRDLIETKAQVGALVDRFDAVVRQTEKAKEAAKRTSSAFLLKETVDQCLPLGKELLEASSKSELGQLVVDSIPTAVVGEGASSLDRLKVDYSYASRRGLSVAMVPEGKTGTIWGHFLGAVFSRLKLPVEGWIDEGDVPKNNEERIRRAGRMVEEGDLGGAIVTLESLNGLSKDVMNDWVGAAKGRVAADLAAEVLLAEAIIAQAALTGEENRA
eukprot:GFKZ01009121.1.p1 GENE.GFKZ01009121.1~~GFKZ01009121.1.p1  ORF type:complete len:676 (+),score=135.79 GFKZ01009121.1:154-2181(+)